MPTSRDEPTAKLTSRLMFNRFLGNLPKPTLIKARLDHESVDIIRQSTEDREKKLSSSINEPTATWATLSEEKKTKPIPSAIERHEQEAVKLNEILSELMTEKQKSVLAEDFLTTSGEDFCCDSVIRQWLKLTRSKAIQYQERAIAAAAN